MDNFSQKSETNTIIYILLATSLVIMLGFIIAPSFINTSFDYNLEAQQVITEDKAEEELNDQIKTMEDSQTLESDDSSSMESNKVDPEVENKPESPVEPIQPIEDEGWEEVPPEELIDEDGAVG
ncbi:MAG: hypothetical protein AAGF07_03055 [Patescibacteria group bacterium]